jgi:glycogen(starch) synthase
MKVLMLGWEFPPHISGGLGTACFGLTQGLAHHGVEVTFVVPKTWGDEDQSFVRLVGANTVPVRRWVGVERTESGPRVAAREPGDVREPEDVVHATPPRGPVRAGRVVEELARTETLETTLRLLEVESTLRPYLGESGYLQYLTEVTGLSSEELVRRFQAAPEEARRAVRELQAALFEPGVAGASVDTRRIEAVLAREEKLAFSGFYGPDLMARSRATRWRRRVARRESFDVVHAHDWMTYPAGIVAARSRTSRWSSTCTPASTTAAASTSERIARPGAAGLDAADRVICVSHYTANTCCARATRSTTKLRVVHNAVTHKEQAERWHAEKHVPEPIVLFLGRVTFQKGPDYFLEAAARVVKVEPNVKFVMSGSGDMLPKMIERAARLGLARHVHFTGFLKGADVERMYAMADIYVMPSVSEPFGISPLEAMALDVPVIVSRQSGVSEVLRNALKVDFWDVQEIANKILALLKYPRRCGSSCRARAATKCSRCAGTCARKRPARSRRARGRIPRARVCVRRGVSRSRGDDAPWSSTSRCTSPTGCGATRSSTSATRLLRRRGERAHRAPGGREVLPADEPPDALGVVEPRRASFRMRLLGLRHGARRRWSAGRPRPSRASSAWPRPAASSSSARPRTTRSRPLGDRRGIRRAGAGRRPIASSALFGRSPTTFRNTELVSPTTSRGARRTGLQAILGEGADHLLGWRSPHRVYRPEGCERIKILLRSYKLSDDIAFRFSNRRGPSTR